MDALITLLMGLQPLHWAVFGLALLIAEMATGTTYLLWPAVAAFVTAVLAWLTHLGWAGELVVFAVLVVVLTALGRPLVQRWRDEKAASGLNERSSSLIGARGVILAFENGAGAVKIGDTQWRAVSDEALAVGQTVEIAGVDGATLKVRAAA